MKGFEKVEGVVTLNQWTMMGDGHTYLYIWCKDWTIITDKAMSKIVSDFRSSEKWQLFGLVKKEIKVVIPGCQVKAWAMCKKLVNPQSGTYILE